MNRQMSTETQQASYDTPADRHGDVFSVPSHLKLASPQCQPGYINGELTKPQNLRQYLGQIGPLHSQLHCRPPPHLGLGQAWTGGTNNRANFSSATATGQTPSYNRFYPLRLQQWSDFPECHKSVFSSLQEQLGNQTVFPSQDTVQASELQMKKVMSTQYLGAEWLCNHIMASTYFHYAVEKPSAEILAQYLAATGDKKKVFFEDILLGVEARVSPVSASSDQGYETISSSDTEDTSEMSSLNPLLRATQPDRVVVTQDTPLSNCTAPKPEPEPYRLVIGQHKPPRAADLQSNPVLPEDCLVRMAIASRTSMARKDEESKDFGCLPSSSATESLLHACPEMAENQVFFASDLAEAYHYMITSGLEYGYLVTGHAIAFLRIPLTAPTTLLYYTSTFHVEGPNNSPLSSSFSQHLDSVVPPSALRNVGRQGGDDALAELAVSQLCSLFILASTSPKRPFSWVAGALRKLSKFPELPDDGQRKDTLSCPVQNCDEDRRPTDHALPPHGEESNHGDPTGLSYCTQKCLLGLMRGLPLDDKCPNYLLHKDTPLTEAPRPANASGTGYEPRKAGEHHPITGARVSELVREQIGVDPEASCTLLYSQGLYGAVGCLLRLSVKGYGYTFVAKGVESMNSGHLQHETYIYKYLHRHQGILIPVHLGLVELRSPYPFMAKFTSLSHFMLMSYAGKSLNYGSSMDALSRKLGRDLVQEIDDTYDQLFDWGLDDQDNVCNAAWCEETQRIMKIDFDHCILHADVYMAKSRAEATEYRLGSSAARKRAMIMMNDDNDDNDLEIEGGMRRPRPGLGPALKRAKHAGSL
ncbi:hypothetical protein HOO65_050537 [Ceratocystis lukuohia]|uniref:Uncharacterized protein n=1 Tax=Ceratocystis lukuohia TaxID=2019550 RepID=A0ABR4MGK2_9PEZI